MIRKLTTVYAEYSDLVAAFGLPTDGPDDLSQENCTCQWFVDLPSGVSVRITDTCLVSTPRMKYNWTVEGKAGVRGIEKAVHFEIKAILARLEDPLYRLLKVYEAHKLVDSLG